MYGMTFLRQGFKVWASRVTLAASDGTEWRLEVSPSEAGADELARVRAHHAAEREKDRAHEQRLYAACAPLVGQLYALLLDRSKSARACRVRTPLGPCGGAGDPCDAHTAQDAAAEDDWTCDACGRTRPGQELVLNGAAWLAPPHGWFLSADGGGEKIACGPACARALAERAGERKTSGGAPSQEVPWSAMPTGATVCEACSIQADAPLVYHAAPGTEAARMLDTSPVGVKFQSGSELRQACVRTAEAAPYAHPSGCPLPAGAVYCASCTASFGTPVAPVYHPLPDSPAARYLDAYREEHRKTCYCGDAALTPPCDADQDATPFPSGAVRCGACSAALGNAHVVYHPTPDSHAATYLSAHENTPRYHSDAVLRLPAPPCPMAPPVH